MFQYLKTYSIFYKKLFAVLLLSAGTSLVHAQALEGDVKRAESKLAMCIGCHGIANYKASFPFVYEVPSLHGQNAAYLENALKAYQDGSRKHPSMRAIAASLTEQDMADLALYYAQKPKNAYPSMR